MSRTDKYQTLRELIDVVLDEEATQAQVTELQAQLKNNPDALKFYYDYIGMHMHLRAAADRNLEFVYRRMSEEFIVRPSEKNSTEPNQFDAIDIPPANQIQIDKPDEDTHSAQIKNKFNSSKTITYIFTLVLALLVLMIAWLNLAPDNNSFTAKILTGNLSILEFGKIESGYLYPGEYRIEQATQLELQQGDILNLVANSVLKVFNDNEIELIRGKLTIDANSQHNIYVHGKNFGLHNNGDYIAVDLTASSPIIQSGEKTLLVPAKWRPRHYWSFNDITNRAIDSAGSADGLISDGATRVTGLLGNGAFEFNNKANARINVGNGGAQAPVSGTFSVRDGITIEALIEPKYLGEPGDDDHIFRKDQTDGNLRILLSFQNDKKSDNLRPKGEFNESISFGLFLLGQGYQELRLPLDGKAGRPTLAELQSGPARHLVATYDSYSGFKAIYLDGKKMASFTYPKGSKILSGGQGMAHIGNNPNSTAKDKEAFNGIIDEVAFYGFALPPYMVNYHWKQVNNGLNYYGLFPDSEPLPNTVKIPLPANSKIRLDASTGLPHQLLKQK